jgi:hypothetical protein
MTAFGNARLDHRGELRKADLPEQLGSRPKIGFLS